MIEKKSMQLLIIVFILLSITLLITVNLKADTVILNNGTLLVGKVKSEFKGSVIFKNTYGAFVIRRGDITALYVTKSYKEDIAVRKKLGMDFDEKEIKNNYEAGQRELTETEKALVKKEEKSAAGPGLSGWIFAEGAGMASFGELKSVIPYGFGGFAGFEAGQSTMGNSARNILIPWFRAEAGYLQYSKDESSLSGFTGGAGPLWILPVSGDGSSSMRLALEPGISSINIDSGAETASSVTFTLHAILGYEYSFDYVSFFINLRYMYVYDKDVFYHSAGVSAGVSGRLF